MDTGFNTISKLYSIDQIADVLNVSKITVYRLVEARKIPFYKIKGCIRFAECDVVQYLENSHINPVD